MNDQDIISFFLAFLVLYFTILFLSKLRNKDMYKKRLQDLLLYKERLIQEKASAERIYRRLEDEKSSFFRKIIGKFQRIGTKEQEELHKQFDKAGLRSQNAYIIYATAKVVMIFPPSIIAGIIVFYFTHWSVLYKIIVVSGAALAGSYSVDFVLNFLINARQERILRAFPSAIDLMVICAEAGLSLAATIQRVAREISPISPDLGYELALLSIELNMLPDRAKALQNFSERLDAPYFKSVVANIMQAEQYGTPVAQTMRTLSDQFRQYRLLEAEERAAKLPIFLSIPMMVFIFPCIYIVLIGPAIIKVLQLFK